MNNTMLAVSDFGSIGTALAMIAIAFMQFWNAHKSAKRDEAVKAVRETTEKTAAKVEEVHKLTNGGMGEQLKIAMVSAQTLFSVTHDPAHGSLANAAKVKYEAHAKTEDALNIAQKPPVAISGGAG